jgi:hypothetical protein
MQTGTRKTNGLKLRFLPPKPRFSRLSHCREQIAVSDLNLPYGDYPDSSEIMRKNVWGRSCFPWRAGYGW